MTNTPLKPCPFCGSDAELVCGSPGCWFVLCKNCGAASDDGNKNFTVDRWNTRADAPMTDAELEREAEKIAKDMFDWVDSANAAFTGTRQEV